MNNGIIGIDESGKGDYFGPLVIAGVYIDDNIEKKLSGLNIRDSKLISDNRVLILSEDIKKNTQYSIVVINPERYNEMYEKIKNLNKMLAWGHARVIENLLDEVKCNCAISDKFGNERFILNALMKKGKKITLKQEIKAEKYLPVAAASIIARAEYITRLDKLGKDIGINLPKGASSGVEDAAKRLVKKFGEEILLKLVKVHFKTTKRVLNE
ncbi:MAG: ribonuclease HIII [Candidatus Firestonebacteria bacterium]